MKITTRQTPTDPERRMADYAFAHWTRVLAGLGRVEMVQLLDAAEPFRLEVVAVELPAGTDWVVPSVVQLRQNHDVAIIARDGEVYEVADPSFGRNQFLSGAALWSEASGVCLVPARRIEGPWRLLADAELDGVVGRGYVTSYDA